MMAKLASALSFICGADHPCTVALKKAAESKAAGDIKTAPARDTQVLQAVDKLCPDLGPYTQQRM